MMVDWSAIKVQKWKTKNLAGGSWHSIENYTKLSKKYEMKSTKFGGYTPLVGLRSEIYNKYHYWVVYLLIIRAKEL